jgi:hypothetical protein
MRLLGASKESPDTPVWFILIDQNFTRTFGLPWSVDVPSNGTVSQFLEKVKALDWEELDHCRRTSLLVWKLPTPQSAREVMKKEYLASVKPPEEISEVVMEVEEVKGKAKGKGKAKEEVKTARLLLPGDEISLYLNEPTSSREIRVLVQIPPPPKGTSCCAGCHGVGVDASIESQRLPLGKWQM